MLLRKDTLDKIKAGDISIVFRKWKRPTVKSGGTLKTCIGILKILAVDPVRLDTIPPSDLELAGIDNPAQLDQRTAGREGQIYRISLAYGGPDPRIALRENTDLSREEIVGITAKLDGYDKRSKHGPWAHRILELIAKHPGEVSTHLADRMGVDRFWLKGNIRKLKALGLTVSRDVGYELSARGNAYLRAVNKR